MEDKINSLDMNDNLDREEVYNLLKTYSPKINKKISKKINIFKYNKDFFEFYSNIDIKNLLYIFECKLSENNDVFFSSFKSDIDQYISCMAQIILSIKLFLKTTGILSKTFINVKNHLLKLKYKNKLENINQNNLFLYLESLLKNTGKNSKNHSSTSTELSSNFSSFEDTPKNILIPKFSNENKIDFFSNDGMRHITNDCPPTPRFESELDKEFKNANIKNSGLEKSPRDTSPIKKSSVLTLSEYVFVDEPITPQNFESKLTEPSLAKFEIKKISSKILIENANLPNIIRSVSSKSESIIKNNKKNHFKNLLEMINNIYKKGLINSEEKIKLKKLVIEKSEKIEYFYYNIYKNSENDKTLINEVRKIIKNL